MTVLYIVILGIAYIAIGAFISGLMDSDFDDGFGLWCTTFWPAILIIMGIFLVSKLPMEAGKRVNEWFYRIKRDRKRNTKKD